MGPITRAAFSIADLSAQLPRFLGLDEDSLVSEYALETKGRAEPGVVGRPSARIQNSALARRLLW